MFTGLQQCSGPHEGLLAQVTKSGGTETLTYLHTDHLATPRYGTNAAGSTVWTWDSGAFGKEAPTGTATVNLRFPGQYFDAETTLHYNWNRYYNPQIGRYISSDPIGLAGGRNTFGYAGQSPIMFRDPEGLEVQMCCLNLHCWVKTEDIEAGYGSNTDTPDVSSDAKVVEHRKDLKKIPGAECNTYYRVDESCVNKRLREDMKKEDFGQWDPVWNQCRNYAWSVIHSCRPWWWE